MPAFVIGVVGKGAHGVSEDAKPHSDWRVLRRIKMINPGCSCVCRAIQTLTDSKGRARWVISHSAF
ncbi:MAG TPA: hypothetical protein VE860_12525, partial [Chthoniobacterales bacterium]|nr:hypothetical protein [Chthoniobacterales bacterium]